MSPLFLTRARLRRDAGLAALGPVLLPDDANQRAGVAHRLAWSLFADTPDRRRDFLYREERPGELMALSARAPDAASALFEIDSKPFAPELQPGDRLGFLLRANATITLAGRPRGVRADVVMHALRPIHRGEARQTHRSAIVQAEGEAWLQRIAITRGFTVEEVAVDGYDQLRIPRAEGRRIEFSTLDLRGLLTVQEPALFLRALAAGFGRARAFGCGLMLIRRT